MVLCVPLMIVLVMESLMANLEQLSDLVLGIL